MASFGPNKKAKSRLGITVSYKNSVYYWCNYFNCIQRLPIRWKNEEWITTQKTFCVSFFVLYFVSFLIDKPLLLSCLYVISSVSLRELYLSTKFPHQEIRWNYGIFRSIIHIVRAQFFFEKITFLTSLYAHVRVRIRVSKMLVFRKGLCTYWMDHHLRLELKVITNVDKNVDLSHLQELLKV